MAKLISALQQVDHSQDQKLCSLESEKRVLCAALTESRSNDMREISAQLLPTDFSDEAHQTIWRCRTSLADAGAAHDVTAVLDSARRLNLFFGGTEYVMGLATDDALATSSQLALRAAAKRIKDFSILRSLRESLQSSLALIDSGSESHESVTSYVSDSLENIRATNMLRSCGPMHVMHFVDQAIERVEQRLDGGPSISSVSTGFAGVDKFTDGLNDGELVIIAARPSMGKTAISLAIAESVAGCDRDVLFFSTEQGGAALATRMVASNGRVDASNMRKGVLADGEFNRMMEGAVNIAGLSIWVDETSEITLPEIKARARIWVQQRQAAQTLEQNGTKKGKKFLICLDYLQRVSSHRTNEGYVDIKTIVSEISTGLKNLAKELKCPVLALAQLNRECEKRANKRPMLSDLSESGKIEQDADVIMFLYRDEYYNPNTNESGITEVIIAKNREGAVGVAKLAFEKRTQKFTDIHNYD